MQSSSNTPFDPRAQTAHMKSKKRVLAHPKPLVSSPSRAHPGVPSQTAAQLPCPLAPHFDGGSRHQVGGCALDTTIYLFSAVAPSGYRLDSLWVAGEEQVLLRWAGAVGVNDPIDIAGQIWAQTGNAHGNVVLFPQRLSSDPGDRFPWSSRLVLAPSLRLRLAGAACSKITPCKCSCSVEARSLVWETPARGAEEAAAAAAAAEGAAAAAVERMPFAHMYTYAQ